MAYRYSLIAVRNIRSRGIRSWLTMLGIFIGITAVVALISLGTAMEEGISAQFTGELNPYRITVSGRGMGMGTGGFSDDDVDLISGIRGVDRAVPRYTNFATMTFRNDEHSLPVINIPDDSRRQSMIYENYDMTVAEGRLVTEGDSGVVLMGDSASTVRAFQTDVVSGDVVRLAGENLRVVGILESTGNRLVDQSMLMPQHDMERIFDLDENYHSIDVRVMYRDEVDEIAERIREEMRRDRNQDPGEEDFEIETALEAAEAAEDILNTINVVVIGIALISLFVGGVGITNTMYMSVLERRKEIGVMKSVGAKKRDITTIFLVEAGLMGMVGGLIGSAVGLGMAWLSASIVNELMPNVDLSVTLSLPLMLGVIGFSFLVGTISGVLPALQASSMNPVDALRK